MYAIRAYLTHWATLPVRTPPCNTSPRHAVPCSASLSQAAPNPSRARHAMRSDRRSRTSARTVVGNLPFAAPQPAMPDSASPYLALRIAEGSRTPSSTIRDYPSEEAMPSRARPHYALPSPALP